MNVIQFTPRRMTDAGLFEPLASLAGLRPGDSIEQTGAHQARLSVDLTPAPEGVDIRLDGGTLVVVEGKGARTLRRFDLAEGVSITATRRTTGGLEIDFVRSTGQFPVRDTA